MDKKKVNKEHKRLEALLDRAEVPQQQKDVLAPVIDNMAWQRVKLDEAREQMQDASIVCHYDNGGGQEGGLRSGTEDPPSVAAFAKAASVGFSALPERSEKLAALRARLLDRIARDPGLSGVRPNLPPVYAPHIVSLTLPRIKSETMLHALSARGIYVSSGSACSSHGKHGTSALTAFGLSDSDADATIRVSFSYRNTPEQVDLLADALSEEIARLARF